MDHDYVQMGTVQRSASIQTTMIPFETPTPDSSISATVCCGLKWSRKSPNKLYLLLYTLIGPFIVIVTAASFEYGLHVYYGSPHYIFPSLGPTAFLHFAIPNTPPATPKNTLIGHFIGIMAGSFSLQITGLYNHDLFYSDTTEYDIVINMIFCSALSLGLTCSMMVLFKVGHPPAGATTLIVSLGILKTPKQLAIMMTAVLIVTLEAFVLNNIFRKDVDYPVWAFARTKANSMKDSVDYVESTVDHLLIKDLKTKMDNLTVDNWMECFQLCSKIEHKQTMKKLIEFETIHYSILRRKREYERSIPFSARFVMDRNVRYSRARTV